MIIDSDQMVHKLIFLMLTALFTVMTAIGGFTAQHMISQIDEVSARLNRIESTLAATDVYRMNIERRLDSVEGRLNGIKSKGE